MVKTIIKLAAALVIIFAAGVALLLWNIDPVLARLKPRIAEQISTALGQDVAIGKISARLFPSVAVEVQDVSLARAPEDASIKTLLLNTSLTELIAGKVTVSKLTLRGARLTLTRSEDGSVNLGGIKIAPRAAEPETKFPPDGGPQDQSRKAGKDEKEPPGRAAEPEGDRQPAKEPSLSPPPAAKETQLTFQLQNAEIEDLSLRWIDGAVDPEVSLALEHVSARIRNFKAGEKAEFELHGTLLGNTPDNLSLSGTITVPETSLALPRTKASMALNGINLEQLASILKAYQALPEGLVIENELSYRADLTVDSSGIHLNPLVEAEAAQLEFKDAFIKPKGTTLRISAKTRPGLNGSLFVDSLDLNLGALELHAPFSYIPAQGTKVAIKGKQLALSELGKFFPALGSEQLAGQAAINVTASLPPSRKSGEPDLSGTIVLNNASTRAGGIPISELDAKILFSGQTITAAPLSLRLADQALKGEVKATGLKQPAVRFELSAEQIALGPILKAVQAEPQKNLENVVFSGVKITGDNKFASRSGTVEISIGKSEIAGAVLDSVSASLSYLLSPDNSLSQARLSPAVIKGFGGSLTLEAELKDQSQINAVLKGKELDLASLSSLALHEEGQLRLTGVLSELNARLAGDAKMTPASIQGNVEGLAVDGEISGFNVLRETLNKVNQIPGVAGALDDYIPEKYRHLFEVDSTQYERLVLLAEAGEQVADLQTLSLEHEAYILAGRGKLGFDGSVALQAQLQLTPAIAEEMFLKEPKLKLLSDEKGRIVIPVVISRKAEGKPIAYPDVKDLLRRAAQNTAREAGKRTLDRVAPGLGGALDSLLK